MKGHWTRDEVTALVFCVCNCDYCYAFATRHCLQWNCFRAVHLLRSFVQTDLSTTIFINGLSSLDETYTKYLQAPTDDLIRFWMPKVKVIADRCEGIHICAGDVKVLLVAIYVPFLSPN